jgi:AAA family ATP:ADP antiporter
MIAAALAPTMLLPAALLLKISESGIRYSLDQATRELLFLPVPSLARLKAKATIDVFVQRMGKGVAALLLLPVFFGLITPIEAGWITFGLIAIWLVVTVMMRRQYVQSFRDGLSSATVDTGSPIDLSDATSLELLIKALDSTDPRQVIHSLELLEANNKGHLVPRLMLRHEDPRVRRRTLRVFAKCLRADTSGDVLRLATDEDIEVRVEAIRAFAALQSKDAFALMLPCLRDGDVRVRAAAIAAVAGRDADATEQASRSLASLVIDDRWEVRAEAAKTLSEIADPVFEHSLVELVFDPDHRVVRQALRAIRARVERSGFNPTYVSLLIHALGRRRLKHDAREGIVVSGSDILPALVHFLQDPGESIWVRRAIPKTLAQFEPADAVPALVGCIAADDTFLRRKVIEALVPFGPATDSAVVEPVRKQIRNEARAYLQQLADLVAIGIDGDARLRGPVLEWVDRPPTLLHHLLGDRLATRLDMVFGLLSVLHGKKDMRVAYRGLVGSAAQRSHALEYLDNTLTGDVRSDVFIAVGDQPQAERLRHARQRFGVELDSREGTLRRLMAVSASADDDTSWLAAAAVHAVYVLRVEGLYAVVREQAGAAGNPLVLETARCVTSRWGSSE